MVAKSETVSFKNNANREVIQEETKDEVEKVEMDYWNDGPSKPRISNPNESM